MGIPFYQGDAPMPEGCECSPMDFAALGHMTTCPCYVQTPKHCPFCGGAAHWGYKAYTGSFGTGMERPKVTIGCPVEGYWMPLEMTEDWAKGRGMYSVEREARINLLRKWERRVHA